VDPVCFVLHTFRLSFPFSIFVCSTHAHAHTHQAREKMTDWSFWIGVISIANFLPVYHSPPPFPRWYTVLARRNQNSNKKDPETRMYASLPDSKVLGLGTFYANVLASASIACYWLNQGNSSQTDITIALYLSSVFFKLWWPVIFFNWGMPMMAFLNKLASFGLAIAVVVFYGMQGTWPSFGIYLVYIAWEIYLLDVNYKLLDMTGEKVFKGKDAATREDMRQKKELLATKAGAGSDNP